MKDTHDPRNGTTHSNGTVHIPFTPGDRFRWDGIDVKAYSSTTAVSDRITKQILFHADENLCSEVRYFEAEPGGYSALEKHAHVHAVVILRGHGTALVGREIITVRTHDVVFTPPDTWHQFYAAPDSHLGFLCIVNGERVRPIRPVDADLEELMRDPVLKRVIR
ncbi:MAG: cupin domain-containing protein [Spirochaetaceae bacterium]|nr:MAG: cupin domain-containing protein [Spirochaetaceae bacterium]